MDPASCCATPHTIWGEEQETAPKERDILDGGTFPDVRWAIAKTGWNLALQEPRIFQEEVETLHD